MNTVSGTVNSGSEVKRNRSEKSCWYAGRCPRQLAGQRVNGSELRAGGGGGLFLVTPHPLFYDTTPVDPAQGLDDKEE